MISKRLSVPKDHDAVLIVPKRASLAALVALNRELAASWEFGVGGRGVQEIRQLCRGDVITRAAMYTERLGISARRLRDCCEPIVMSGHQPGLHHPGVWMKTFLLQQLADEVGASAVNLVVDTDAFEAVHACWPDVADEPVIREAVLARAHGASCYATAPVPSAAEVAEFCAQVETGIAPLKSEAMAGALERFKPGLLAALSRSGSVAEFVTLARRNHEIPVGSDYSEVALSALCAGEGFAWFVSAIICDARRFADCYNEALGAFRTRHKTRSKAQPTPDLATSALSVELPFWLIDDSRRRTLVVDVETERISVRFGEELLFESAPDTQAVAAALAGTRRLVAPKALALTLFARVLCCDAFIHGLGGARYDEVTDDLSRAYYGVEPPAHITASMTLRLPLDIPAHDASRESAIREELSRLEHHPDAVLSASDAVAPAQRARARELVSRKQELVRAIGLPGADKKELGGAIRQANHELSRLLDPLRQQLQAELDAQARTRLGAEVLGGREYPMCFFDPIEVAQALPRR